MQTGKWIRMVAVVMMCSSVASAGSLDPTNAPSPTMHTLEEIYQKVLSNEQKVLSNEQKLVENRTLLLSLGAVPATAGMVLVPAGTFTMGWTGIATPEHSVTLSSFYLSKYETTYQLWHDVKTWASGSGYTFANPGREGRIGTIGAAPTGASSEPVTTVSWRDAIVWCNARSEQAGLTPAYTYSSATIRDATDATACDGAVLNLSATGTVCPPRRNGSTRRATRRVRPGRRATTLAGPQPLTLMQAPARPSRGTASTVAVQRIMWVGRPPTSLPSSICPATYGSGAGTGMVLTVQVLTRTRLDLAQARPA
ncbi:MAG: SUMF1/EgtB/PvdO family nonheme iron enzyme [Kiritimatiellae bacterium]|nr:SUMF1/EgtB/PvdO family nonheme iron enzyme [Kiritimatiellia bacterium]